MIESENLQSRQRQTFRIKEMSSADRPRERLIQCGVDSLNNYELLAILLKTGVRGTGVLEFAQMMINRFGGIANFDRVTFDQLKEVKGIGDAKAAELIAAIEFGRRISYEREGRNNRRIQSSQDVYDLVSARMSALDHEQLWVLNLDTKNQVIAVDQLYKGAVNASMIRTAEVFQGAVSRKATSIILVHNHPSGDPTPSGADFAVTRNVREAGKILDIQLLDHVVIGIGRFCSIFEMQG